MREDVEFSYHELHVQIRGMYLSNLMCCFMYIRVNCRMAVRNGGRQSGEVVKASVNSKAHSVRLDERTPGRVGGQSVYEVRMI